MTKIHHRVIGSYRDLTERKAICRLTKPEGCPSKPSCSDCVFKTCPCRAIHANPNVVSKEK